jgi:hypothetical protein
MGLLYIMVVVTAQQNNRRAQRTLDKPEKKERQRKLQTT